MKCFYHPQIDAVGMCSQCGKTACQNCIGDVGGAMICSGCWSLAQREEEIIQQEAVIDKQTQIRKAKNRILWSWVFAGIGFLIGLIFAVGAYQDPTIKNRVVWILGMPIGEAYFLWSMYWAVPVVWGWMKKLGEKFGFVYLSGNIMFWYVILALCCSIPLTIATYYGMFGGAIYQFIKYRKIASQSAD
jgi:hypothetical protein